MSFLFELEEAKLAEQLPLLFEAAEREIKKAEPLFELDGISLELIARNLAKHQAHYSLKAQEMKHLTKWLDTYRAKLEAQHTKNYNRGQRALGATEQRTLMGGEPNIVEVAQLNIEATLLYSQLNDIVEAFRQMGWMVGNITKLRVADLQDIIL